MIYRKLERAWSNNHANYIPKFHEVFPELRHLDREELCDRLVDLDLEFYYEKKAKVNFWVRFTLPLAVLTMLLMIIGLPINFIITGRWGYYWGKKILLLNWFKSLKLA